MKFNTKVRLLSESGIIRESYSYRGFRSFGSLSGAIQCLTPSGVLKATDFLTSSLLLKNEQRI
jgi:hypothetical protein